MKTEKKKRKIKGFTLVEIMVVLLIISIIGIIAIPNINNMRDNAKQEAYNKKVKMINIAAENYVLDNKNKIVKACKSGANSRCYTCGADCYNVQVGISDLINNGGLKPDTNNDNCQITNPFGGCMYSWNVNVRFSNKKQTKVISQNIVTSKPKNMKVIDYIKYLAKTDNPHPDRTVVIDNGSSDRTCTNTLAYDGTGDNNLRYIGGNPCNYVVFNNELWRIVGAMNNIEDGSGNKQTRAKLVRNEFLDSYQYDPQISGARERVNDWTISYLKEELNGDYLNYNLTEDTKWRAVTGWNNVPEGMEGFRYFDHTKALKKEAQDMIDDVKWHLGAITISDDLNVEKAYAMERGTNVWGASEGQTCADEACPRATEWIGKVGLPYISDQKYATNGQYRRSDCLKGNWRGNSGACGPTYNYLLRSGWSITPTLTSKDAIVTYVYTINYDVKTNQNVYPSVYLKPNVKIASGNGSETDPYILK